MKSSNFEKTRFLLLLLLVIFLVNSEVLGMVVKRNPIKSSDSPSVNKMVDSLTEPSSAGSTTLSKKGTLDKPDVEEKYDWYHQLLRPCSLPTIDDTNLLLSYSGQPSKRVGSSIPHGQTLVARCSPLSKLKLYGATSVLCNNGKWSSKFPTCLSTALSDSYSRFSDDHPPQIIAYVPGGSAGESETGELVVRPFTAVHLDCIFYRRLGNPFWYWKNSRNPLKRYPNGWAIASQEKFWRYRISIFSIEPEDEGEYFCKTPQGHTNSIRILVQTIQCPKPVPVELPLHSIVEGYYAGQKEIFYCASGYMLKGHNTSQCLTSGFWSEQEAPTCELIQCSYDIDGADPRLEFDFLNGVGLHAMVTFSCPPGYQLTGSKNATCKDDFNWYPAPPVCMVECPVLLPPLNGRIIDSGSSHFVGDVVRFSCNRNFQLVGQQEITCTESGTWSSPKPTCDMFCAAPKTPLFGKLSPNKPFYEAGTTVRLDCSTGYKLLGKPWLLCQQDGTWSTNVGLCIQLNV